eukprot:TRINITY_DN30433_c0_g2_i1.p1 TRINITY_DN30433_c0_g2~~TRINITY_DN30433_c0_g2_i1.p1  ORF type:complete len:205 (+),score=26.79 TRINITY_DN30433_c0_g2_i1:137-751(+)
MEHVVIGPDMFLFDEDGQYCFTRERLEEAWEKCWKALHDRIASGSCTRIVALCGLPGSGKSSWTRLMVGDEAHDIAFFDDLLLTVSKRSAFLAGLENRGIRVPVEIVVIQREFDKAVTSMRRRRSGHQVPMDVMTRFQEQFEVPCLDEGFARVRVFHSHYDDESARGGFVLLSDTAGPFIARTDVNLEETVVGADAGSRGDGND